MERYVRTNLDLYPETWPELHETPQIGSHLEAKSGLKLRVSSITYRVARMRAQIQDSPGDILWEDRTACDVWLAPFEWESINDFHKRYQRLRETPQ